MSRFSSASEYAGDAAVASDIMADKLARSGKKILKLNRGDPAAYFPTPKYIIDEYVRALQDGKTGYSYLLGVSELREAVVERYKRIYNASSTVDDVIITEGVSEALSFLNASLINPKDKAVLFRPYYSLYYPDLKIHGGIPILEHYIAKENWNIDLDSLKRSIKRNLKGKKKIKYILLTNPNNPTGTVLDRQVLKEIVEIAKDHDILLISDEIYDEITYNGAEFTSIAQLAGGIPHVILNGASKGYDATGFRIGYMLIPNHDKISEGLKERVARYARLRVCASTAPQYAIAEGMRQVEKHEASVRQMVMQIESRANFAVRLVNESKYIQTVEPRGAYYILPRINMELLRMKNDKEFAEKLLLEEHVQVTQGSGFGEENHFRIVTLATKDILELAINKINAFCKRHSR